ncbi:three-Cys-motif partner protein TcmP [candidate division WOR-3 bacterium]|nr:three-Cys-motif partner protein TcmP [candidate division WOR-3 bacterium]
MSLPDSSKQKWICKEHTKVKHSILKKYLHVWIVALGKWRRKIIFFDGFAGRGEYYDKKGGFVSLGSPIIALKVADNLIKQSKEKGSKPYFDKFLCIAVEKNHDNFNNLLDVYKREEKKFNFPKYLDFMPTNNEFKNVVSDILKEVGNQIAPTFFFVDPFGYSGVPFSLIDRIINLPKTEIFFTLMTRDIRRFLDLSDTEVTLDELFGCQEWRDIRKVSGWEEKDIKLRDLYIKQLNKVAKFVFPFRVCMDRRAMTLYYLIHATNHFLGLKIMKENMFRESDGFFSYLGPNDYITKQRTLFDNGYEDFKSYLISIFRGEELRFQDLLERTYMNTQFIEGDYKRALKELEKEKKLKIVDKGPRGGISGDCRVKFKDKDFLEIISTEKQNNIRVSYEDYKTFNNKNVQLVNKVSDGSIIIRFDKTPVPKNINDVICPHFMELKWAYGCPFDCSWCYLKGTFRFRNEGIKPAFKDYDKIKKHVIKFLANIKTPELLNTGEIADSLMGEHLNPPFSKFIINLFEKQKKHKVLFVSKSDNIENILDVPEINQAIFSFSLNAIPVAERWENVAPAVGKRIAAAQKLYERDLPVRIRIDPMVPIEDWNEYYIELIDLIFENFIPERITFGSLRGLQSTINNVKDKTWTKYLKEDSNWGKKVGFETRLEMYSEIIEYLRDTYDYNNVALCKETVKIWDELDLDWKNIKCNCIL